MKKVENEENHHPGDTEDNEIPDDLFESAPKKIPSLRHSLIELKP